VRVYDSLMRVYVCVREREREREKGRERERESVCVCAIECITPTFSEKLDQHLRELLLNPKPLCV